MINNKNGNSSFYCSNCGAELEEDDVICSQCGADVSELEEEDNEISPLFGEEEVEIRCTNSFIEDLQQYI
jgi:DNA-directed RNA polymerase subunit RPC12/RpoP